MFPQNPYGSKDGVAAVAVGAGRVSATMPHPERCF
ncbi:MAG: hypothetical protein CMQ27_05120 [Gammaproteobacteria bacterium]|nr:hypothetical protein [Gammaproteobacteria bacterium]